MPQPISHRANSGGQSPSEPHGPPLSTRNVSGRPQRRKARRKASCTSVGGTVSHRPRGENLRRQNGAGALIDDAQPADELAGAEADLFGGIDLPDLVGAGGPWGPGGGATATGGLAEAGLLEPALQGADGRGRACGMQGVQAD